ncbi:uncharacterized protein LOC141724245 [Apium graveolens]|uniref:uncharacterized protein LOC141724245 n=1 Tax=Apium graveolens TaxID=4045 RepID=UPI003D79E056
MWRVGEFQRLDTGGAGGVVFVISHQLKHKQKTNGSTNTSAPTFRIRPTSSLLVTQMAPPRIPKSFGTRPGDKPRPKSKKDVPAAQTSVPTSAPIPQTTPVQKQPVIDLTEKQGAPKKHRTEGAPSGSSTAFSALGPMGALHVSDEEVEQWQAMDLGDAARASIKASCQLFIHSTQVVDKLLEEKARLERLQGDNNILKNTLTDKDFLHAKDIKAKDSEISFLKHEVANLTSQLEIANKKATSLHTELVGANLRIEYSKSNRKQAGLMRRGK